MTMKAEEAQAIVELACDYHLNKLETAILHYAWDEQSYQDIASSTGYEVGYIKQIGAQLWRQLSNKLGEKVTKSNLHGVLQRRAKTNLTQTYFRHDQEPSTSCEFISSSAFPSLVPSIPPCQPLPIAPTHAPLTDWGDAPDISAFYGRCEELTTLKQWVLQDHCRLVALLGMGGIGKTTLAMQVARQLQARFDWVIWRSLQHSPPLLDLLTDLLRTLGQQSPVETPTTVNACLRKVLEHLRHSRGLLILDNVETIMQAGQFAGCYPAGYEAYGQLWSYLGEREYQSIVLLTSREQPRELTTLEGETLPIRSIRLSGISPQVGQQLMQGKGKFEGSTEDWQRLVDRYGGNPLALKMVTAVILKCFDGQIPLFLELLDQEPSVFEDIRQLLAGQIDRLTHLERQVMYWLTIYREPVTLNELLSDLFPKVTIAALLESLTSLQARSLIEKQLGRFTLQPVVMEYMTNCLIQQVSQELQHLESSIPSRLLTTHALLNPHAPDYRREVQQRLIVQAVVDHCIATYSLPQLLQSIRNYLNTLREQPIQQVGYLGGNLLNLLIQLRVDLTNWDFSQLPIWQADLRGAVLQGVNLAKADLTRSSFTEAFGQILSVAFSPDGKLLATGDVNHEIWIRQVSDGKPLLTLKMPEGWVWSVAFSPNGRLLASSANRTVSLWDVQTGHCFHSFRIDADRVFSLAFSPNGEWLASGSEDGLIRIWEVRTRRLMRVLKGHDHEVRSVTFAPHCGIEPRLGSTYPSTATGYLLASGSYDRTVRLWDVQTGTCTQILRGHEDWVWSVAFSPDGQFLASGSRDRTIKLWQVSSGYCTQTLIGHPQPIRTLAFGLDGKTLASGCDDYLIRLWNYQTGECLRILKGHRSWISALAFNIENGMLASGSEDQSVRLWEGQTYRCLKTIQGHSNGVWAIAFHPTGTLLASGHQDSNVYLWSPIPPSTSLPRPIALQGHSGWVWSVAFSPDGQTLASGSEDRTVRLWQPETGQCLSTLRGHDDSVFSVIFSLDSQILMSGSLDGTVRLWSVSTAQCYGVLHGHRGGIWTMALSPDGQILASGSQDATVRLWDISTGQCLRVLAGQSGWIRSVAFSPDGTVLGIGSADGLIQLWDLNTGICCQAIAAQAGPILAIAFDPQQPIFASSGVDASIQFWHWQRQGSSNIQIEQLALGNQDAHDRWVRNLSYSPNGQLLVSCSQDETIKLWQHTVDSSFPHQTDTIFLPNHLLHTLQIPRPYEATNMTEATGLTSAQVANVKRLGAALR